MTNKELTVHFQLIETEETNVFDVYCRLYSMENDYKTTEFYEKFNMPIIEAYELYIKDTTAIGKVLRDFKNVDLPNLATTLTEQLNFTNGLENLSPETANFLNSILEKMDINE